MAALDYKLIFQNFLEELIIQGTKSYIGYVLIFIVVFLLCLQICLPENKKFPKDILNILSTFILLFAMGLMWVTLVLVTDAAGIYFYNKTQSLSLLCEILWLSGFAFWIVSIIVYIVKLIKSKKNKNK